MELLNNVHDEHLCNKNNSTINPIKSILIRCDPGAVIKSIKSFDNIINTVQYVALCIPEFTSNDQAQFWKETVSFINWFSLINWL